MNNVLYAFLLSTLAGLSTMFGALFIILFKKKSKNIIIGSLSFAGGVMISISLIDLIPESLKLLKTIFLPFPSIIICSIFIVIGILISAFIDKYLPTDINDFHNKKLYRVGIISMIAIILHNIPEGIATFMTTTNDLRLGVSLCIAITCHNIPEGISIFTPIYYATNKKRKALLYTFISSISEPLGALFAFLILKNFINNFMMSILLAIIAGIMLHISFYELLPTAKKYNNLLIYYIFIIIGIIFMIGNHLIFH
ncbi:MAG: ZIP family metal transporter [Mollicutes bacterium]|nr:ZIP family metal transporter [Mollicutes bacterium]